MQTAAVSASDAEHVERGQPARRVLDARRLGRHAAAQRLEDLDLALDDALVGAEDLLFVLLERRRDEALAAGNRLLAVVVRRHAAEVRLRDLDVVAEHAVVADLELGDAGAGALGFFHLGNPLLAGPADAAQVVELGIDAVAHGAAVARQRRRLVEQRAIQLVAQVGQIVELGRQAADERRLQARSSSIRTRGTAAIDCRSETRSRGPAVPSAARATSRSMSCTIFSVSRTFARSVLRNAKSSTASSRSWMRSSASSGRSSQARISRPPIGVTVRSISCSSDPVASAVGGLDHLEVPQRGRIDDHAVGAGAERDLADVGEIRLLRVAQVLDQRAGRAGGGRAIVQPEAVEGVRLQLRRAACGAPTRTRTSSRRPSSRAPSSRSSSTSAANVVEPAGATISRGRRTASSSASA